MARRLSQRHGKPRARLDTASTRSSFFSSSASFLCHRFFLHRPAWQFFLFVFRFSCCHRPVWQFSRFVFRCHGGKPPPARLLAYANTPLPPLRALSRRARNARALPILSHRALRSAPLYRMLAFSTNEQHHEETLDNSALFAPSSPLLNWITDRDKCMSSECDGRDAQHPHMQFKHR